MNRIKGSPGRDGDTTAERIGQWALKWLLHWLLHWRILTIRRAVCDGCGRKTPDYTTWERTGLLGFRCPECVLYNSAPQTPRANLTCR